MPVVVATFDFAFCLRCGCEAEGDAVEAECGSELGEGVGSVGEKEGVIIDVESQRKPVEEEDGGEEIEMGGEGFGGVKAGTCVEAGGVVEDVEKHLFLRGVWEKGVRGGVVLPKRAEVADLPAADGFCGLFETSIRGEPLSDSPAADRGAVGLKIETAKQLAGDGTVGGRRRRTQQPSGQSERIFWPRLAMVAARRTWLPQVRTTFGTGAEIIGAKLINPRFTDAQLGCDTRRAQFARAEAVKQMADERRGETVQELRFSSVFIRRV